jgi:hypothetical protein
MVTAHTEKIPIEIISKSMIWIGLMSDWVSPLPPGLPIGQVVYDTHKQPDGSAITHAPVVNGSCDGWHYDLHGIDHGKPAFEGQPLGPSCRIGGEP